MFMGEYAHNIDRKGRLIMPAKFREELGEHVVVNRGLDGCLYVYTVEQWQQVYQKLSTLPSTNKDARMYQRMMLSSLIALAGLEKECLIIGVANHLEIWSKNRWEALEEEQSASFEEAAEHLSEIMG